MKFHAILNFHYFDIHDVHNNRINPKLNLKKLTHVFFFLPKKMTLDVDIKSSFWHMREFSPFYKWYDIISGGGDKKKQKRIRGEEGLRGFISSKHVSLTYRKDEFSPMSQDHYMCECVCARIYVFECIKREREVNLCLPLCLRLYSKKSVALWWKASWIKFYQRPMKANLNFWLKFWKFLFVYLFIRFLDLLYIAFLLSKLIGI